jgi:hypothetical protein
MARRLSLAVGHLAALMLVGVLIGVISCKFSDIVRAARNQAARSALAEAHHACSTAYARLLLQGHEKPTALDVAMEAFGSDFEPTAMALGNRTLDVGIEDNEILFRVVAVGGSDKIDPRSTVWKVPDARP